MSEVKTPQPVTESVGLSQIWQDRWAAYALSLAEVPITAPAFIAQPPTEPEASKSPAISRVMGEYGGAEARRLGRVAETTLRRKHASAILSNLVSNLVFLSRSIPYST